MKISSFILLSVLMACCHISVAEPKRSFGLARSRPKSNNMSVRRRGHLPENNPPRQAAPPKLPSNTANQGQPVGPPPAYSASSVNAAKANVHAAPPAYSPHANAPPSYSAPGTGLYNNPSGSLHSNAYPKQTYSGVNSAPHQSSYGWNTQNSHSAYGANHMPSYGTNNHMPSYGGYGGHAYGNGMMGPAMGGGMMGGGGGYGGYGGGMMNGGMMGGGMMGGGMMNPGMMGGGLYQQKQSGGGLFSGIGGHLLTGFAGYQLARAIGGGGSHHQSTQHIYHHHETPQQAVTPDQYQQTMNAQSNNQQTIQSPAPAGSPVGTIAPAAPNQATQYMYGQPMPSVPLAPFPNESTNCTENCTEAGKVAETVTPVPEFSNEYSTIHPSLFPYATFSEHLPYWATSHNKALNLTTPDTTDSSILSTTISS